MPPRKKPKGGVASGQDSQPNTSNKETRRSVVRRRRGCLQDLPDCAVEIQLEVFRNVHPRDLLNLARTCKRFRDFFLHPSNERLWEAARANVEGLPPRPPFLSEPAFINLLFFPSCHNCGQGNVRKVIWQWFVRYCPKCLPTLSYNRVRVTQMLMDLSPGSMAPVLTLFQPYEMQSVNGMLSYECKRLNKREVDALMTTLRAAGTPPPADMRAQILATQKQRCEELQKYSRQCMNWHAKQKADHNTNLEAKREQRFKEIVQRLRDSGWDKEIDFIGEGGLWQMASLPVVRQSSKLTPKAWEKVQVAVNDFLTNTRKRRLDREREDELRPRFLLLEQAILSHYVQIPRTALMECRPDYVDIALMTECKAIADAPGSVTVTREDFAAVVPGLAVQWEEELRARLSKAILRYLEPPPAQETDPLSLAVALFPCARCDRGERFSFFRYPAVLGHPCARTGSDWFDIDIDYAFVREKPVDVYRRAVVTREPDMDYPVKRYPFALTNMACELADHPLGRAVQNMSAIVSTLGLDPKRATFEDLQNCEGRLQCYSCTMYQATFSGNGQGKTFTWEAALAHSFSKGLILGHNRWTLVNALDALTAQAAEAQAHALSLSMPGTVWACAHCINWDERGERSELIKSHLLEEHGITYSDECMTDGTIYLHPGKATALLRPAVSLPFT
ncbi:hypothetical protein C8Q80DRAFT_1194171 [Daedaleopsis nitida]|nr:hypothetical protein C8Q80DRAFT_1194171 [Daedaleopsis nitida]